MLRPQQIDDVTRRQYAYLTPEDECYFLYEYTPRAGFGHSTSNNFIQNFKKPVARRVKPAEYQYKLRAIADAINMLRQVFSGLDATFLAEITIVPIPPSRVRSDAEYDDRLWQLAQGICKDSAAEARELIWQSSSYEPSHTSGAGNRIRPDELRALYRFDSEIAPRSNVVLIDDVLAGGCHFRVGKDFIRTRWPHTRVLGFFLARSVHPDSDPTEDFDVL